MSRCVGDECYLTLAGFAHDLRARLLRLQLHIDRQSPRLEPAHVAAVTKEIEEVSAILVRLVEFARGSVEEVARACDVNSIVTEICDRYRALGHDVRATLGEIGTPPMRELAVRRIVGNLVDNGLRYGGKEVEVSTRREGRHLVVCVTDRGPGVNQDNVDRLLEPFVRGDPARSKPGAGLGLAIVDRLARACGGSVSLRNRRGGGLRVVVTLALE